MQTFETNQIPFAFLDIFKNGFSEGLGATFHCVARRHSLTKLF